VLGGTSLVASELNLNMENTVASNPTHYKLIDWNGLVQANPGLLQSDTIHPNATGQTELADWYALALSVCP
jgi:lysophospholipase L1-like esterase